MPSKEYRQKYPIRCALSSARTRAKKAGVPFELTEDDLPPIPTECPVLNIPIHPAEGRATDNSPSLDRLQPEKGYCVGNVIWISQRANRLKNDATLIEMIRIATYYQTYFSYLDTANTYA